MTAIDAFDKCDPDAPDDHEALVDAAREISRLQAENQKLREALRTAVAQMEHCGLAIEPMLDEALSEDP